METSMFDKPFKPYFTKWDIDTDFFPLTHLEFPILLLIFYVSTVLYYQPPVKPKQPPSTSTSKPYKPPKDFTKQLVLSLHNLILCIFSVLCFINTAPVIYNFMVNIGWRKASCGLIQKEYESNYGFWSFLFYLSKYYEFLDTYIVIWKGRRPIFLQKFHHMGAVIGMWFVITTRSTCGYIFVVENSFIHSIMYLYYALSVWKIKIPFKFMITILQMIQFISGMSLGIVQLVFFGECLTTGDVMTIIYHELYVGTLFVLFRGFYKKTYIKKNK